MTSTTLMEIQIYTEGKNLAIKYGLPKEVHKQKYYNIMDTYGIGKLSADQIIAKIENFREELEQFIRDA